MQESQISAFRARLTAMLEGLTQDQARGRDATRTVALDQQSVGRLSRMDALQQQAMSKATQARRSGQSARIRAALARIDADEFGYCEDCGDEIAPARLEIDPTARLCITCARG